PFRVKLPDHRIEWNGAIRQSAEHDFLYLPKKLAEACIAAWSGAQDDCIGEGAHQTFEVCATASIDHAAHHQIILSAVAMQQSVNGSKQQHVGRDTLGASTAL